MNIECDGIEEQIIRIRQAKTKLQNAAREAIREGCLILEKEIKIVITEYSESHKVIRYRKGIKQTEIVNGIKYDVIKKDKDGNIKYVRKKRRTVLGGALINTGYYRKNWKSYVEYKVFEAVGHVTTNTEYAFFLEKGTAKGIKAYRIVETAFARCKNEIYEVIKRKMSEVVNNV